MAVVSNTEAVKIGIAAINHKLTGQPPIRAFDPEITEAAGAALSDVAQDYTQSSPAFLAINIAWQAVDDILYRQGIYGHWKRRPQKRSLRKAAAALPAILAEIGAAEEKYWTDFAALAVAEVERICEVTG